MPPCPTSSLRWYLEPRCSWKSVSRSSLLAPLPFPRQPHQPPPLRCRQLARPPNRHQRVGLEVRPPSVRYPADRKTVVAPPEDEDRLLAGHHRDRRRPVALARGHGRILDHDLVRLQPAEGRRRREQGGHPAVIRALGALQLAL